VGGNNNLFVPQIQIRIEACWAFPERWHARPFLILHPPSLLGGGFFIFKVFILMSLVYNNIVFESIDVTQYNDEDFIEVFVMEFRPWIRKNHGDEVGEYPMSLLVKKYINEFAEEFGLNSNDLRYGNTLNQMRLIGREIARKGIRQLPSLSKDFMFTEKFKRVIDYFISTYDLPDFVKVHLEETSPFRVRGWLTVDFESAMKYNGNIKELHSFPKEFTNLVTSYLGFEVGNPVHGKIDFNFSNSVRFTGVEEWVKNVLNKKIKKEIKTLSSRDSLHSMKFNTNDSSIRGEILLVYTRNSWYSNQITFKEEFKKYLENLGYNPMRLTVNSN
jgi:hypothetical protein